MDSLHVNAEEIAQAALGVEYMSVSAPNGAVNQTGSEQDWRNSSLPPREDVAYAMGYQRDPNAGQLPLQGQPMPQQQIPPPRQPYSYNTAGAGGYGVQPINGKASAGNQQSQLKQAFPGGILGGPRGPGGPPQQHPQQGGMGNINKILGGHAGLPGRPRMSPGIAGMRFDPNGQPMAMTPASMGGYGPANPGKGGPPRGSLVGYDPNSSYAGSQSGYHNPTGYASPNPGMNGGYGMPEYATREGAYGFGVQDYEMAPAEYSVEQEGGWNQRWDPAGAGGMRAMVGPGPRMMRGRGGMGAAAGGMRSPVSRAIFINQVPPEVTYEELCDAVGAFGSLDSVKLLREKRQAFINFVEAQAAYQLMMATGQQIVLQGKPFILYWAKTRPVVKELWQAIRNGATRNLYIANVPESLNEAQLNGLFSPFGELESVRVGPKKGAAFVNYTSIASAIKAKDNVNRQVVGVAAGGEAAAKLLINFTTAQQNCMRARGGRPAGPSNGQRGFRGYTDARGYDGRARIPAPRSADRRAEAEGASLGKSRALYMGSVPDSVELEMLASLVESYGVIDSMRLVRPKSCAFINFADEAVARALQAKFTQSEDAAPEINGKKLNINFAKARPRVSEEGEQIAQGARRKLRVRLPANITIDQLKEHLGHKAEMLTHAEDLPCEESEVAPAPAAAPPAADPPEAEGVEGAAPATPVERPPATHKINLSFSSVAMAISVKESLEALTGELTVSGVEFIVEPVASAEEIAALHPSEEAAPADEPVATEAPKASESEGDGQTSGPAAADEAEASNAA